MRNVVKEGGPEVIEKVKKKFKEIRRERKRKALSSSTMFSEALPSIYYTEAKLESYVHGYRV